MTLTELRYIVTLAQEQHFGHAAERSDEIANLRPPARRLHRMVADSVVLHHAAERKGKFGAVVAKNEVGYEKKKEAQTISSQFFEKKLGCNRYCNLQHFTSSLRIMGKLHEARRLRARRETLQARRETNVGKLA